MAKITVLGAGGWGMALTIAAHKVGHKVRIWSAFPEEIDLLNKTRENKRLLPGIILPEDIALSSDINIAENSDITIIAVPSIAVSNVAKSLANVKNHGIVVNVAKGFVPKTNSRLSVVITESLPNDSVVVLSGPSHAEEVARGIPTLLVAASTSLVASRIVQDLLSSDTLRIYTSDDVVGVELGGALKNIIAICAGICDGLKLGDNTKAALITRGLSEMTRLGVILGANESTFSGLTGVGDLVVTCTSRHSRNNRFGKLIGSGAKVSDALKEVGTVEGYYAAAIVHNLAKENKIDLPLMDQCYRILYKNLDVSNVVKNLMLRPKHPEY